MQTIPPRLTIRSPSAGSFDWFKEYIDYSESINGSPTTIASSNPLMEMLLGFQKVLDNYENERAYRSFVEGLRLKHPCNSCRILNTIAELQDGLQGADVQMSNMKIENWAQATVEKAIRFDGRNDHFMALVGEAVGAMYVDLGRAWEAKPYLERSILEMKRLDTPLLVRKQATIALAKCYSDLGNIQQADGLLKVLFKTEYPKIVASSYLALESYCQKCQIRLLNRCYLKAKDSLVQDVNDTVGYEWERDDVELGIRVIAANLIRKFNPRIIEEMGECDDKGSECSGAANDELGD
jgi:tetratricopeptide (TPR) repeat protein